MGRRRTAGRAGTNNHLTSWACIALLGVSPALAGPPAAAARAHWAFGPLAGGPLPAVERADLVRNGIDFFIEAALEGQGLTLGCEAPPGALLRRVWFDLAGLPPGPEDVERFLADGSPDAHERMVERCLASPRHGERWGRHWLDAAGYADSNGYFSADSERPLAYRYRDYVVRSLNADKPFQRFIEEQIAGDELAAFDPDGDLLPAAAELLEATHFLRNAQDGTGESDGNEVEVLIDKLSVLDGTVQILGSCLLGLTFQCARCHDHKFEPIAQAEYYRLQAILAPAYSTRSWRKPADRVVAVGTRAERDAHRIASERLDREVAARRAALEGFAAPLRKLAAREKAAGLAEPERSRVLEALDRAEGKRSGEEKALLEKHQKLLESSDDDLAKRFEELAAARAAATSAVEKLERERPAPLARIAALVDVDPDAPPHHVLQRGVATDPGAEAPPGVPAVLETPANPYVVDPRCRPAKSSGRRLALARWLTSIENPLPLRVTVNRLWHHHFGAGIAATTENLGLSGARPSHPGLIDFLAWELVRRGGGFKSLHRLILTSAAYRQSGAPRQDAMAADPENRLLWRFPRRRLEAEALRDALLAASGELDLRMGGPPVPARHDEHGQVVADEAKDGACRRSLYLLQRRTQPLTLLEVFDAPLVVGSCPRRSISTTPLQSLAQLNSDFALARARAFAALLGGPGPAEPGDVVPRAFLIAFGRPPRAEEQVLAAAFLQAQPREHGEGPEARRKALADFCQILLAANPFVYVD